MTHRKTRSSIAFEKIIAGCGHRSERHREVKRAVIQECGRADSVRMTGRSQDRMDWWNYTASLPESNAMVQSAQSDDSKPVLRPVVGERYPMSVRALERCAENVALFRSSASIIEFDEPVRNCGSTVCSADFILDCHGLTIPLTVDAGRDSEAIKTIEERVN